MWTQRVFKAWKVHPAVCCPAETETRVAADRRKVTVKRRPAASHQRKPQDRMQTHLLCVFLTMYENLEYIQKSSVSQHSYNYSMWGLTCPHQVTHYNNSREGAKVRKHHPLFAVIRAGMSSSSCLWVSLNLQLINENTNEWAPAVM